MRINRFPSSLFLIVGSLIGIHAFMWPLYLPHSDFFLFQPNSARALALVIAFIAVGVVSLDISNGALDSKSVALLGVMSALIAALRFIGAGAIGVEPMWFLLILSSFVFGARYGFALGVIALGISAIATGGIGPWLPFQMLAAGWIGLASGLIGSFARNLSHATKRTVLLCLAVFSSLGFGILMDLQLWPWLTGTDLQLSYIAGDSIMNNLHKFIIFHFATALSWDIPRAITTALLIALTATPIMRSFERAKLRLAITSRVMEQKVTV